MNEENRASMAFKEIIESCYVELKEMVQNIQLKKKNLGIFAELSFADIKGFTKSAPSYYHVERYFLLDLLTRDYFQEDDEIEEETHVGEKDFVKKDTSITIERHKQAILENICEAPVLKELSRRIINKNEKIRSITAYIRSSIEYILKDKFKQEIWYVRDNNRIYDDPRIMKAITGLRREINNAEALKKQRIYRGQKGLSEDERTKYEHNKVKLRLILDSSRSPGTVIDDKEKLTEKQKAKVDPVSYADKDVFNGRGHSPEELLLLKEKSEQIKAVESKSLIEEEREIFRLYYECELSQPEITFFVDPPKGKEISFNQLIDIHYLRNQIRRCGNEKYVESSLDFEKKIFGRMPEEIKKILKTNDPTETEWQSLSDYFEMRFHDKECFSDNEFRKERITRDRISDIFKMNFESLPKEKIFRLNLLVLFRTYPKKFEKPTFRGFVSVPTIKAAIDKGSAAFGKTLTLRSNNEKVVS